MPSNPARFTSSRPRSNPQSFGIMLSPIDFFIALVCGQVAESRNIGSRRASTPLGGYCVTTVMWRRLAVVAAVFNVAGAGFAIAAGEGWHAGVHVTLALAFAFAAQRLTAGDSRSESPGMQQQLDEVQAELTRQAAQLAELNERVDFAERVLTKARDRQTLDK